ncbi:MAG: hypothetical protein KJN98_01210, partial [Pontiella sp.]|nr:hypothetical protein [Pontiella sp.]
TRDTPWKIINFDAEGNLPAYFSSAILALSGLLAFAISLGVRSERLKSLQWAGLGAVLFFLSIDEAVMIHEVVAHAARLVVKGPGMHHAAWVVPYLIAVVILGAIYLKFFLQLPAETKKFLLIGAGLFLLGAVGVEVVSCIWEEAGHGKDFIYHLFATTEETFEMLGVISIIYAFASYLDKQLPELSVQVSSI